MTCCFVVIGRPSHPAIICCCLQLKQITSFGCRSASVVHSFRFRQFGYASYTASDGLCLYGGVYKAY